ncbi:MULTISPECIES: hypothetical protein [Cellulomonas]|uniref:hypothetical protein n=1 Tax=Cellulomonas TaxID=1707 RepID=UPI0010A7E4B3|nr:MULTISPECIES: hypothetical protein [Cellulomonas]
MPLPLPTAPSVVVTALALSLATGGCAAGGATSAEAASAPSAMTAPAQTTAPARSGPTTRIAPAPTGPVPAPPGASADPSADSPTPLPTAGQARPTPVPSPHPAMAAGGSDAAALAGVHLLHLYDHAITTRDVTPLTAFCDPGSTWCAERAAEFTFRAVVPADRAAKVRRSRHENRLVSARLAVDGTWHVQIDSDHVLTTTWTSEATGATIVEVGGGPVRYDIELAHGLTGWMVLEVTTSRPA